MISREGLAPRDAAEERRAGRATERAGAGLREATKGLHKAMRK